MDEMSIRLDDKMNLEKDQKKKLLINEKVLSYVTVSEGHEHPLVRHGVRSLQKFSKIQKKESAWLFKTRLMTRSTILMKK
jgi:hypothetical protein